MRHLKTHIVGFLRIFKQCGRYLKELKTLKISIFNGISQSEESLLFFITY